MFCNLFYLSNMTEKIYLDENLTNLHCEELRDGKNKMLETRK